LKKKRRKKKMSFDLLKKIVIMGDGGVGKSKKK
jgi:GTPase SAR1 family protein